MPEEEDNLEPISRREDIAPCFAAALEAGRRLHATFHERFQDVLQEHPVIVPSLENMLRLLEEKVHDDSSKSDC